jgi:putative ABC transport system permease protein
MNAINERLRRQFPDTNAKTVGVKVVPLQEELVGSFRRALLVLLGAVGVVLLIACSNLANLMLVRATARRKELAVRVALGGSRARVVRELLGESVTLALLGAMLAMATAPAGLRLILAAVPSQLPNRQGITIDATVLWFTLAVAVAAGVLTGLTPAFSMSQVELAEELKDGGRSAAETRRGWRTRGLLVVVEVGLSMVLLVVTGLLVRSFARLEGVDSGFEESKVLTVHLSLPPARYRAPDAITVFQDKFLNSVRQSPGVVSAGLVSILPMSGLNPSVEYTVVGQPPKSMAELPEVLYRMVTPGYFPAMRIHLEEGRDFTDQDRSGGHEVAIINQTMARRYWPARSALGQHLRLDDAERPQREVEIVGVVADVKHVSLEGKPTTDVYVPYRQIPGARMTWATNNMYVVVRTANDPLSIARAVRNSLRAVDSEVPAANTRTMVQYVAGSVAPRRFGVLVLGIFAAVALVLAGNGLYGVLSYAVTERSHEIGVRIALGAQRGDVIRMVVAQAMGLVLVGEAIGLVGAVATTNVLSGMLFAVRAGDPATFATAGTVLILVAAIASYIPARRAAGGDPLHALRFR